MDERRVEEMTDKQMNELRAALSESREPLPGFWDLLGRPSLPQGLTLKWCKASAYSLALGKCLGAMYDADSTKWGAEYRELGKHFAVFAFGAALNCAQHNANGSADSAAEWRSKCERFAEMLNGHVQSLNSAAETHDAGTRALARKLASAIYEARGTVTSERVRRMWADMGGVVAAWEMN